MSRLYSARLFFGLRYKINCHWSKLEEDPLIKKAEEGGLDWADRDMSHYLGYEENDHEIFIGKCLSYTGLENPFDKFTEDKLAKGVAEARERLPKAGFKTEPTFYHMSSHSD